MNMEKSIVVRQLFAGLTVCIPMACTGFHFGWSAPSLPKLLSDDSDTPITSDESSWIVSTFSFGGACGPLIAAALVDRYGRKFVLFITTIPNLGSCILIGLAQSYWWFVVARFIAGIGNGMAYTVAPMYVGEIADARIRGALGTMMTLLLNLGILLTYCVGPWVNRVALAVMGAALPIVFGLMFIWVPESPYFLIMKQRPEQAEKSLLWLRGNGNVTEEFRELQVNVEFDLKTRGGIKDLVMIPGNRKALIIALGLMVAQQLSGITAILAYSSQIFEASGSTLDSSISVIILGVIQLLSGLITIFTVDIAGRRPLLLLSAAGSILFLGGEALYFQLRDMGIDVSAVSWLPMVAMIGYMIFYTVGFGILPHVVFSEIFPCNVKAVASTANTITAFSAGFIVSKLYQIVADAYGIYACFWGFTVVTIFSMIFIYFILPETKQRSLRSIQDEFHKSTDSTIKLGKSELA